MSFSFSPRTAAGRSATGIWLRLWVMFLGTAAVSLSSGRALAQTPTPKPQLQARLSTNKGCLETGNTPVFAVGEPMTVLFRFDSPTLSQANATLFSIKPGGIVTVFGLGTLQTNVGYALGATVGPPTGIHELVLRASGGGVVSQRGCSFIVVPAVTPSPKATKTSTPTPTPTDTPVAGSTSTPTPTAEAELEPQITTNRGCQETGQNPVFHVGEQVTVSFDVDSDSVSFVSAKILDYLANGFVNFIPLGTLATNHSYSFPALIAPPLGQEKLELRAWAFGVPPASAFCTFTVQS